MSKVEIENLKKEIKRELKEEMNAEMIRGFFIAMEYENLNP